MKKKKTDLLSFKNIELKMGQMCSCNPEEEKEDELTLGGKRSTKANLDDNFIVYTVA